MTTIAAKNGIIAFDSRETQGSTIIRDDCMKKHNYRGRVFILAGNPEEMPVYMDACIDGGSDKEFRCCGFMIEDGVCYELFSSAVPVEYEGYPMAFGSGANHAFTAMDCGLSAKDAVKLAGRRDIYTGGKIRTFKIGG